MNFTKNAVVDGSATLVGLHAKPDFVFQELNMLSDVVSAEGGSNTVILGDFNADCDYLSTSAYQALELNDIINWLITDTADTNVASSSCAYDRIAYRGSEVTPKIRTT